VPILILECAAVKLYLDNCCFNRPFDDQSQTKVKLETDAKLDIQDKIQNREYELVWSYILEAENNRNPYLNRKEYVSGWKEIASVHCVCSDEIVDRAERLRQYGIKPLDALHLACAIDSKCDCFLTTDKES
jgi:predicted nucleic acid-binding protein